jgi:hypothetical protein
MQGAGEDFIVDAAGVAKATSVSRSAASISSRNRR